jgi:MFS family permease
MHSTGDKAYFDGHYYSDKAPGLSLAAVPIVAFARLVLHVSGGDPETYRGIALLSYLATVFTAGIFTALAGVSLYSLCMELGATSGGALFAAITFGLGSPIWTLATIFIGHAFSAALLVFAFAAACRARDWRDGVLAGLCAGWATVSEFPAAIPAALIALLTAVTAWNRRRERALATVGAMTIAALACAAALMTYQYVCFGSPFHIAYSSEEGYIGMQQGIFGVNVPRMIRLRRILFGEYRGLLPLAPALAVAPVGLAIAFVRSRSMAASLVASVIAVYYILLNASYAYWEGGWSYGPRHASPAIPFLCIGLAFLWAAAPLFVRWALAALSAYGLAITIVAVSTMPLPPANIRRPVADFLWPAFRDGDLALNTQTFVSGGVADAGFRSHSEPKAAFNLGMKIGLDGRASLIPLFIVWGGCTAVLWRSRRTTARAPA